MLGAGCHSFGQEQANCLHILLQTNLFSFPLTIKISEKNLFSHPTFLQLTRYAYFPKMSCDAPFNGSKIIIFLHFASAVCIGNLMRKGVELCGPEFNVLSKLGKEKNTLNRDLKKIPCKLPALWVWWWLKTSWNVSSLLIFSTESYEDPGGGWEQMRCCNSITERLSGIALPLLNATAEWNCVTSVAKCWHWFALSSSCSSGGLLQLHHDVCVCLLLPGLWLRWGGGVQQLLRAKQTLQNKSNHSLTLVLFAVLK